MATNHSVRFATNGVVVSTIIWNLPQHAEGKIDISDNVLDIICDAVSNTHLVGENEDHWYPLAQSFRRRRPMHQRNTSIGGGVIAGG